MMIIIIMKNDLIRITITARSPILQISFSLLGALAWDSDAATPVEDDDDQHKYEDYLHNTGHENEDEDEDEGEDRHDQYESEDGRAFWK